MRTKVAGNFLYDLLHVYHIQLFLIDKHSVHFKLSATRAIPTRSCHDRFHLSKSWFAWR